MDLGNILNLLTPFISACAALGGILISSKLSDFRLGKVEEELKSFTSHIEQLLAIEQNVESVKEDLQEFKTKEEQDRSEIRQDIEKIQGDVREVKGDVSDLKVSMTTIDGKVNVLTETVRLHHEH